jgi:hypothetical protein
MALNGFTPNTKIESAKVTANFTNLSNHSLWVTKEWRFPGVLSLVTSNDWVSFPDNVLWERVDLVAAVVPTGQAIIVDIERSTDGGSNWTTIFTGGTNRPQVADGARTGNTTTIDVPSGTGNNHLFRAKISQVGSSVAGEELTVLLKGKYVLD